MGSRHEPRGSTGTGVSPAIAATGPSAYWYLTRSTGAVTLVLLTLALVLGVVDVRRWSTAKWPRFVVDSLHRNVSLLALAFLVLHILTATLDSFAPISLVNAVVPFTGSYRPFWLGLGAVSFDLILAVILTSVLRRHVGHPAWRAIHWLTYASWPIALLHGLGTGSDVKSTWLLALSIACLVAVIAALLVRVAAGWPNQLARRGAALGATGAFTLGCCCGCPAGRSARNGHAARAHPRLCSATHAATPAPPARPPPARPPPVHPPPARPP